MCIGPFAPKKQKQQQVVTPEPVVVAPPPEPTPEPAQIASDDLTKKSKGTGSLRIALNIAGPSGSGLNVPGGA